MQEAVRRLGDKTFSMKTFPAQLSLFDVGVVRLAGELDKLKDKLDTLPPVMLKYIAADVSLDPKLRDKAEGRAITLGLLPVKDATKIPPQPFSTPLASDVTTLVTSFAAGNPVTEADNAVIARLALGPASAVQDTRRVARLLSLIEPFGYRVPAEQWGKLFARKSRYDGDAPPAALVDQLYAAAQAGRKAEVILLSGLILSANDMEKTHELVLLPVIRALLICGLTQEAHGIAYDALQSYRAR